MIASTLIENEVIGSLLLDPTLLISDMGMSLSPTDFTQPMAKQIYIAFQTLFADNLHISDKEILKFLEKSNADIELASEYMFVIKNTAEPNNFLFNIDMLKKYGLLRDLDSFCDVGNWFSKAPLAIEQRMEMERKLKDASISEIVESVFGRVVGLSDPYIQSGETNTQSAADGIMALLESLEEAPDYGVPTVDGLLTTITRGTRKKKLFCFSGGTGTGKTRLAIAQAVKCSIPIQWNLKTQKWAYIGCDETSGICTTEMGFDETQTMILATIAGIDESNIIESTMTDAEKKRVHQAAQILTQYEKNLYIWRMPDPNIKQLISGVRKMRLTHNLDNLFFDYVHISPNLISEYSGTVRDDVALLMVVNALKNLANELNLFVWTGTQFNKSGMEDEFITENCLRGSRSIADKLDLGAGMRVPTKEELAKVQTFISAKGITPNLFIDIYKNRRSKYKSVRLWLHADLSCMRYTGLFVTDWKHNLVEINETHIPLGMGEKYGEINI